MITGRVYLERGERVTVVCQWARTAAGGGGAMWLAEPKGAPRNVAIRRADGTITVRPFRGLRKIKEGR